MSLLRYLTVPSKVEFYAKSESADIALPENKTPSSSKSFVTFF